MKKEIIKKLKLRKNVTVQEESENIDIDLTSNDTRLDDIINKTKDYWYEVELNPEGQTQTILGHDKEGPKIFRLYPEGVTSNGN